MAKGDSKVGGSYSTTSVKVQNGETVTLSEPLNYDGSDKGLNKKLRSAVEAWEAKKRGKKFENALVLDENGNVLLDKRGGKHSVGITLESEQKGVVFTHNHPRESSILGGPFSKEDIMTFTDPGSNIRTIRATAAEGTYSMTIPKGYDRTRLNSLIKEYNRFMLQKKSEAEAASRTAYVNYTMGQASYSHYVNTVYGGDNARMVSGHEWLRKKAKEYGYTYTLERN